MEALGRLMQSLKNDGGSTRASAVKHECGGVWDTHTARAQIKLRGITVDVDQEFFQCTECGERRVTRKQAAAAQEAANALLRKREQFLTPGEIREIRDGLGLTQEQLEQALGLGAKTVVRWENGRIIPQRSTDDLLRLIRRDPTALRFLAELHGAQLPDASGTRGTEPDRHLAQHRSSPAEKLGEMLPKPVLEQVKATAQRQDTDLQTWFILATASYLRDSAWDGFIRSAVEEHLEEVAEAFRVTWRIMGVQPQQEREEWLSQHRGLYDKAV
jgi:putative zinc finger/helix-turn-helix YgiT family protein